MIGALLATLTLLNAPENMMYSDQPIKIQMKADAGREVRIMVDDKAHFTLPSKGGVMSFTLPYSVSDGEHVLRAFYVKDDLAQHEGLLTKLFYYKRKSPSMQFDPTKPYLTYNEPFGKLPYGEPVYVDFYVSNCVLSVNGYKVKVTVDDRHVATLSSWVAFPIHGLSKGSHKINIQLIDNYDEPVVNQFVSETRTITIK